MLFSCCFYSKYFPEHKLPDNVIATTDAKTKSATAQKSNTSHELTGQISPNDVEYFEEVSGVHVQIILVASFHFHIQIILVASFHSTQVCVTFNPSIELQRNTEFSVEVLGNLPL